MTRKAIQQLPKEFYEQTLEWMNNHGEANPHKTAWVMEVGVCLLTPRPVDRQASPRTT